VRVGLDCGVACLLDNLGTHYEKFVRKSCSAGCLDAREVEEALCREAAGKGKR